MGRQKRITEETIKKAESLIENGMSVREAAKEVGVCYKTIYNECNIKLARTKNMLYKRLANALIEKYGTWKNVEEKVGFSQAAVKNALMGVVSPRKDMIDALLLATGLKYEEAFKEE